MKTSGTLQSIGSIARSQSANESLVRFNRFTGKAIVMGSSGSRFGLVSWVRKLYTTSSNKKVQRFLMDGIAKEHRNNEDLRSYLQKNLADRASTLWTVSDIKLWNEGYTSLIWRNERFGDVLPEVTALMKAFNKDSGSFVAGVSWQHVEAFFRNNYLFIDLRGEVTEQDYERNLETVRKLFHLFPEENKDVYCAAVLKDVKDRFKNVSTDIPKFLNVYVRGLSGLFKSDIAAKDVAKDYFHQWLNSEFLKSVALAQIGRIKSAKEDAQGGLICPEKAGDGEVNFHRENLGIRVKKLLDTHYRIEERENSSEEGGKKASFHEELQKDGKLRGEAEARLRTKYIAHNKNLTKTVYISGTFLEHLHPEYVNKNLRSAALDAVLLQEIDQIFADYQSKETP